MVIDNYNNHMYTNPRGRRAAEIAPTHPNARLMRRMQDSNFREVRRVTNLLLKIKRHQRRMEALAG